jgi:predicted dehydrogenase
MLMARSDVMTVSIQKKAPRRRIKNIRPIKVGVIGCGYWGPKLIRNIIDLPGVVLTSISDLHEARLYEMKKLYPQVSATRNCHELFYDCTDAVVIATPVHTHYALAKAALQADKHVLVEKPITDSSEQAQELIDLATRRGLILMTGHTFVYNPAVEAVRKIVQSDELGNIYYMNSTRANLGLLKPDINVMWDLAPHDISIYLYILDQAPISVSARGGVYVNTATKLHEMVYMTLLFKENLMANLRLSWLDPVKQRRLTIVGNQKMLVYDDICDNKVVVYDKGVEIPSYSVTEDEFRASYRHGAETIYPLQWTEPLKAECQHFLDCIRFGNRPRSDGLDGLKVLKILETAQISLNNKGCNLRIDY